MKLSSATRSSNEILSPAHTRRESPTAWHDVPDTRRTLTSSGTTKVRDSGLGPDPDQSAKNGPE